MNATTITTTTVDTPIGVAHVACVDDGTVVACHVGDGWATALARLEARLGPLALRDGTTAAAVALGAYFAGDVHALDDVAVDPPGTDFQRRVWAALRRIPVGSTWSYAELAAALGEPTATRAVGTANGANPIWLIVPCHRVVRSGGQLGGYAGGVERKSWLLAHEGATIV